MQPPSMNSRHSSVDLMSPARDGGIRKKMRKGTHSCFECRRRKIRCIFSPGNTVTCSECFARGSRCIDQERADPNIIVDQRKNLRERVARLESLIETLLEDRSERRAARGMKEESISDSFYARSPRPGSLGDVRLPHNGPAPVLSLLDNDVWSRADERKPMHMGKIDDDQVKDDEDMRRSDWLPPASADAARKNRRVCQLLREALPDEETLRSVLDATSDWWTMVTSQIVGAGASKKYTSIYDFTESALGPEGHPVDTAKVLQFVAARSSDAELEMRLALIEQLIIHDDEYMGTLSGVEVALIQTRMYADIGQARRSWLTTRRALNFAQLMGLHRTRVNIRQDFLWWGLFQSDRYISLLLGTPYALADMHCNLTFKGKDLPLIMSDQGFLTRLAMFAGKVIDRTHSTQESTFSSLLAIDQELTRLGNQMPAEYWTLERCVLPGESESKAEKAIWFQKALGQALFYQTRLILHIPYMLKSITNTGFEYSRDACFESARGVIHVFLLMREGDEVMKTKFLDFVAFMAAVTLVMGLIGGNQIKVGKTTNAPSSSPGATTRRQREDWELVDACIETYRRCAAEPFGKVAGQSYKALQQLTKFRNGGADDSEAVKVVIPFFGTITIKKGKSLQGPLHSPANSSPAMSARVPDRNSPVPSMPPRLSTDFGPSSSMPTPLSPTPNSGLRGPGPALMMNMHYPGQAPYTPPGSHTSSTSGHADVSPVKTYEPQIAYDGVYMQHSPYDTPGYVDGGRAGLSQAIPSAHLPPSYGWQNVGTFDLDQDWNWLVNEMTGAAGQVPGNSQGPSVKYG